MGSFKDAIMAEDINKKGSNACVRCLRLTPWATFVSAALFAAGLVLWAVGASRTKQYSLQFASLLGASSDATSLLDKIVLTAILAVAITGVVAVALILLISFMRTAQRSMLWGGCCCTCDRPDPWVFTMFKTLNGLLGFIVWLLLSGVVLLCMAMLLWLGAALAVEAAVNDGVSRGNAALGGNFGAASDALQALIAPIQAALPGSTTQALSSSVCPPVCLNLGSFGILLDLPSSCICGSDTLVSMRDVARKATTTAAIGLAGAGAMYFACTWLLIILARHQVQATYDRSTARRVARAEAEAYERGFQADPQDIVAPTGEHPAARMGPGGAQEGLPIVAPPVPVSQQRMESGAASYEPNRYSAYV